MKRLFTFLSLLLFSSFVWAQQPSIPINFESSTITYEFADFGGGVGSVVDNPQASGINTSGKVGKMVKFEGEVYGGSTLLNVGVNFGDNNAIKMKVLSNRVDGAVLFKLEGPSPVEVIARTTVANQWEELTFGFAGLTSLEYTGITIIYDLGIVGDGSDNFTFYFDDIEYTTKSGGVQIPIDFESTELTYAFSDFAGGVASVIPNPQSSGINTSGKVGQMVKFAGEVYGGSTLALGGNVDFGNNNAIKMKVYANRADAPVLFKLEGPSPVEVTARTTVANQWEELTFGFAGLTGGVYTGITIIYDLGVNGDGSANFTLLFDDIAFTNVTGGVQVPINFESTELSYNFSDFAGGVASIIDNPQASGINTSAKVGQMIKFAGEVYGGSTLALGGPINFGDNNLVKMKVYANRVGASVLFKLEGPAAVELFASTTVANAWEELTFNATGFTNGVYTGITIIYDLGVNGDGGADFTLLFDDISLANSTNIADFQELGITYSPNPINNYVNIAAKSNIDAVSVFNLSGQEVLTEKPNTRTHSIDLSSLPSGTYILRATVNGEVGATKLVKQ